MEATSAAIDAAEAISDSLESFPFPDGTVKQRDYYDLQELSASVSRDLHVTLVPSGNRREGGTMAADLFRATVVVLFVQKLQMPVGKATTDGLVTLVAAVDSYLRQLGCFGVWQWEESEIDPIVDVPTLRTEGIFLAAIEVTVSRLEVV